ncbi:unnamed protein product [Larinioides sclopetarius]|uniref:Uncharacterized protein n=1 Tax=Larinioides sclopetarius TaxID=280406 RepID=A0AAV2A6N5_9ARAC
MEELVVDLEVGHQEQSVNPNLMLQASKLLMDREAYLTEPKKVTTVAM